MTTIDFNENDVTPLSEAIAGKTVKSVRSDQGREDYLIFDFTDGTSLRIRYDYIYDYKITKDEDE